MERKILCYDLHDANAADYQDVYDYIETELDGTRATESVYIFFSDSSNSTLRDDFVNRFGKGVSIIVNSFPTGACCKNIDNSEKWLKK